MAVYRKSAARKVYRKKTVSKPKVSTAVKSYVKKVMKPMKPEVKRQIDFYTEVSHDAIVNPYSLYELAVVQGTTPAQRTGNIINLIGLNINAFFRNNATTTEFVRTLVLSCPSDTDTAVATMELFQDATTGGGTAVIQNSGTNAVNIMYPINKSKFKVHYDHVFKLGGNGSTEGKDVMKFNKFLKFQSKIKFDGTGVGLGNASRRFLVVYLTSDPLLDSAGGAIEITGINNWYFTDS